MTMVQPVVADSSQAEGGGRLRCADCGSQRFREPVYGCLTQCRECSYLFYPHHPAAPAAALYDAGYFTGEEYLDYVGQRSALAKTFARYLRMMRRYGVKRGRLFEVGCAHGFFLDQARATFEVAGMDVSPVATTYAREQLELPVQCGEFADVRPREPFDVVCMWETLEHVFEPRAYVAQASAMLVPGGHLFLTVPDIGSLTARLRGRHWRQIHPPTHVNYFSGTTLTRLLVQVGFHVRGLHHVGTHREVTNMLHNLHLFSKQPVVRWSAAQALAWTRELWGHAHLYLNLFDLLFVAAQKGPAG